MLLTDMEAYAILDDYFTKTRLGFFKLIFNLIVELFNLLHWNSYPFLNKDFLM